MHELPHDWLALCAVVFLLGLRHGFDADHLAAIDGLTRVNARAGAPCARWCGTLFSLGHGAVVMAVALVVGAASTRWATPAWLDLSGAWISIAFLLLLGTANLHAVLAARPGHAVPLVALKSRWLARGRLAGRPWLAAPVGMLFALSFDTVSQAALFALSARHFGGIAHALGLGALFVLGMLATDGLNGLWISRLLDRADAMAARASRVMGLAVAVVSLLVGALGIARLVAPALDERVDGAELLPGAVVVAVIAASYLLARWLARRGAPPVRESGPA
ncbi:MAG: nickel transporter [Rubrivivax sp. SCN 70-15]|nr:MAG: nickel transporter [Rubrivivax sp. SCN 70-15]